MNKTFTLFRALWIACFVFGLSTLSIIQLQACDDDLPETHLHFIENNGQWADNIQYQMEMNMMRLFLEEDRLTYVLMDPEGIETFHQAHHGVGSIEGMMLDCHAFHVNFVDANPTESYGSCLMDAYRNYFQGSDQSKWASHVGQYQQVDYASMYEGVDMRLYGVDGSLKYDFIVAPGADVNQIKLEYEGTDGLSIVNGDLHIATSVNTMIEQAPYAYQFIDGQLEEVPCNYALTDNVLSFDFPDGFDASKELIIDPTIIFSTYSGSTADNWGFTATYDNEGFLYGGGVVFGVGYPTTTGAYQVSFAGGTGALICDIGLTKYTEDGSDLVYATYVGGSTANEMPHSLVVNNEGEILIYGTTGSDDYPTHDDAYSTSFFGGPAVTINSISFPEGSDIVVTKLSSAGDALIASTYIGGIGNDGLNTDPVLLNNYADEARGEIFFDLENNVYVASTTNSPDFPATLDSYQPISSGGQEGCILKFNEDLSELIWGTHLGGTGADAVYSVKPGEDGTIFACGGTTSSNFPTTEGVVNETAPGGSADAFVAKLSTDGDVLIASTYLGTSSYDQSYFVDLDLDGALYTFGQTSGDYPVEGDVYSEADGGQFISKLNPDLTAFEWSTVFGRGDGDPDISPTAFLVDKCDQIFISGWGGTTGGGPFSFTTTDMTVTADAYQNTTDGSDFYFAVFTGDASDLLYATYFGASGGGGEHVDGGTSRFDKQGVVYQAVCAGCGASDLFPTTPGAWSNTNNSSNCNLGTIKFDFELAAVVAEFIPIVDQEACGAATLQFENFSTNVDTYFWEFGDGDTSEEETPEHTYDEPGEYTVVLTVSTEGSCNGSDTSTATVTIFDEPTIDNISDPVCIPGTTDAVMVIGVTGVDDTYTLSGFYTGTIALGEELELIVPGDGSTIEIIATGDESGCVAETSVVTPVCDPCDPEPVLALVDGPTCIENTLEANLTINVSGFDESFTLSGDAPAATVFSGVDFSFNVLGDGSTITIIATGDETGCEVAIPIELPICVVCEPDPGVMSEDEQVVCHNGSVSSQSVGPIIEDGQTLYYAAHTSATAVPGTILAINETGTFSYDDLSGASYNTEYYISPIVAFPAPGGGPDLEDDCTVIAAGTPFVFLAPIQIDAGDNCDNETGFFTVIFSITGGLPAYDSSFEYLITGSFIGDLEFGDSELIGPFMGGEGYNFNVTDELGCSSSLSVPSVPCLKVPIELANLEGVALSSGNELRWTTATEINNNYFSIESSTDGTNFQTIGTVDGAGNSEQDIDYSFLDADAACGTTYYRLSWTDFDGLVEYAPVISVSRNELTNGEAIQIVPSIANADITVYFPSNGATRVSILDITGKQLHTEKHSSSDCHASVQINVQSLPTGIYFVRIDEGLQRTTTKFVKQ